MFLSLTSIQLLHKRAREDIDKYREKKREMKILSYPKGHSCISHLIKIICTTEYLFLEARRFCEAVQMSAKTHRPAPSNDIGYLAICFILTANVWY